MSDSAESGCAVVVGLILVGCVCFTMGLGQGQSLTLESERQQAVKAGVGQYATNPKTGETTFVYGAVKQ